MSFTVVYPPHYHFKQQAQNIRGNVATQMTTKSNLLSCCIKRMLSDAGPGPEKWCSSGGLEASSPPHLWMWQVGSALRFCRSLLCVLCPPSKKVEIENVRSFPNCKVNCPEPHRPSLSVYERLCFLANFRCKCDLMGQPFWWIGEGGKKSRTMRQRQEGKSLARWEIQLLTFISCVIFQH